MKQYIDKSAVVAEIEKRLSLLEGGTAHPEVMKRVEGVIKGYKSILSFLDTLETKEVDLEEEINRFWNSCIKHKNERGGNVIWSNKLEVEVLARYFYELGLKAMEE